METLIAARAMVGAGKESVSAKPERLQPGEKGCRWVWHGPKALIDIELYRWSTDSNSEKVCFGEI
jgi:hypothetical protein